MSDNDFMENFEDVKKRIVAENDFAVAFLNRAPIVPGHVLIVPKRAVKTFDDLLPEERAAIFNLCAQLKPAMQKAFGATGFNFAWNEGEEAGQTVPHFHLHMLPRKEGDTGITEYEPRKFLYRTGARAISPTEELQHMRDLLRNELT